MKEFIFDLTDLEMYDEKRDNYTVWADHPARTKMESTLMDCAGKIVRITIKQYRPKSNNKENK
jgi:hypothetical protein